MIKIFFYSDIKNRDLRKLRYDKSIFFLELFTLKYGHLNFQVDV